jgi:Holliday junction resolvase
MAATPEKKVKDKVRKTLTESGAFHFMPATHGYGTSGVPDIVGCYKGRMFAIECKAGDNKPTALQLKNLSAIAAAGGYAEVINEANLEDVAALLARIARDAQGKH